jgi:branched-chain amino acid transport system substrate-binding protein
VTHQVQQTVYLARKNRQPADKTDHFEILGWSQPDAVKDDAAPTKCNLVPYDKVPTVDA